MAQVIDGRYTARMDESFAVFMIGMWLPLHKDPEALEAGVTRAGQAGTPQYSPTV